jgi:hypothetical protein
MRRIRLWLRARRVAADWKGKPWDARAQLAVLLEGIEYGVRRG